MYGVGRQLALEFLAISPCWLFGYLFAGFGSKYSLPLIPALTLFLMIPMVSYSNYGAVLPTDGTFDDLKCLFLALLIAPLIHTLAVRELHPEAKPIRQGWWIPLAVYALVAGWARRHPLTGFHPLPMAALMVLPVAFFFLACLVLACKPSWPRSVDAPFRRVSLFLGGGSYALYAIHTPLFFLVIAWVPHPNLLRFAVLIASVSAAVVFLEYVVQPRAAALIDRLWPSRGRA